MVLPAMESQAIGNLHHDHKHLNLSRQQLVGIALSGCIRSTCRDIERPQTGTLARNGLLEDHLGDPEIVCRPQGYVPERLLDNVVNSDLSGTSGEG